MRKYSLLVFDWDGTLMDSKTQIVNCMKSAIAELGLATKQDHEISNIIGLGLDEAVMALFPELNHTQVKEVSQTYREHYLYKDNTPSPLFSGVPKVLDHLANAGYDLAVATGKSRRGLDKGLDDTGLKDYFPITRCADETRSKPHPQMLEEILIDHNVNPKQALMIGDTEYDMQLASNARVDAFAVSYGVHDLLRLLKQDPVGFIDRFDQLPDWLEQDAQRFMNNN